MSKHVGAAVDEPRNPLQTPPQAHDMSASLCGARLSFSRSIKSGTNDLQYHFGGLFEVCVTKVLK